MNAQDVLTSSGKYPEREKDASDEVRANAAETARRVSLLGLTPLSVSSGFRPAAINVHVKGAAVRSNHIMGRAVDLVDTDRSIVKWCLANLDKLKEVGLWMEEPASTPGWCHLQTVPPKSGNRVFKP